MSKPSVCIIDTNLIFYTYEKCTSRYIIIHDLDKIISDSKLFIYVF